MKAKFVNEKFEEKSDPVRDMGIGFIEFDIKKVIQNYEKQVPGHYLFRCSREEAKMNMKTMKFIAYCEYGEDNKWGFWEYVRQVDPKMKNYHWEIRSFSPKY